MSNIVTVGNLSVELDDDAAIGPSARIAVAATRPVSIDLSRAAGKLFFDELTKIREALVAAHDVLAQPGPPDRAVTPEEVRLVRLLVDLEIVQSEAPQALNLNEIDDAP
jgi:hypothetical protein